MRDFDPDRYMKQVLMPAAEIFSSDSSLPDVFARYELPLDCSNTKDIEQAVQKVTAYWVKQKNNIKYKRLVEVLLQAAGPQGSLDLRTLKDPVARAEQRNVVEQNRKQQQQARLEKLKVSISGFAAKGYITPTEKRDLIARYVQEGFTESEIVSLIRVPEREDRKKLPTDQVGAVVSNQIRTNLATLKKRDLYEFLGLELNAAPKEIQRRHAELLNEWDRRLNGFDKSAAKVLLGIIQTHFFSGLEKYEQSRVAAILDRLRPEIRMMAADKRIAREEFNHLLELAAKMGLEKSVATEYILSLTEEAGASLEWSAGEETIACAACSTMCPKSADKCKTCGSDLRTDCPKCKTRVITSQRACTQCGFVVANLPKVKLLVRQAQLALDDRDIGSALVYAREAEELWGRSDDVATILKRIETVRRSIDEVRERAGKALAEKRLYAAKQVVAELAQLAPHYTWPNNQTTKQLSDEIQAQLASVDDALRRAAVHERNRRSDETVFALLDALAIASDAEEARNGLKRHPPQPVTNVRASVSNDHVLIQWSPTTSLGDLEYVVVRRELRAPSHPQDGDVVTRTTATSCSDRVAGAGSTVFYSVFAERGGVVSNPAASPGLLITLEVSDFRLDAGDGFIRGSWVFDLPEGRVRVFRREAQPPETGTGHEISISGHSFKDSHLQNGRIYYYRVQVEYRDARGSAVLTTGVVESAKPDKPPKAIDHILVNYEEGLINLTWTPPPRGTVSIYRSTTEPDWKSGTQLQLANVGRLGARVQSTSESQAVDQNLPEGAVYYTPLTVFGDVAIIGTPRRFVALPDIQNLVAEDFGRYLQLRWEWPKDCSSAMVAWRLDAFPEDAHDPLATKHKISLGQYEREGAFRFENPTESGYKFVVFAALEMGGETVYSAGVRRGSRAELRKVAPVSVSYTLSRGTIRRSRFTIELSTEKDISQLPVLVVVAKPGGLQPLQNNDGNVVTTFGGTSMRAGEKLRVEFKVDELQRPTYFRAFFREKSSYQRFRLIDPPSNQLLVR
ncbi:MAG TPA: zinc ribbon domain-containing protein [Pyrinomonadaceae bacterium]|nr:zinc ribbon domain-containing protein [Pyrinomonadaceae bacterium]